MQRAIRDHDEIEQTFPVNARRRCLPAMMAAYPRSVRHLPVSCLAAMQPDAYHAGKTESQAFAQETVVDDSLTIDEFDALSQISRAKKRERVSACVARNAKRLAGLKYVRYGKDGQLALTEKGQQALFVKRCIDGLRAVANDAPAMLDADVAAFLSRKGHITPRASEGFDITQRGRESLADIESTDN